ncbi:MULTISPECIES: S1 RNA-binding domain-containing protein [Clostridium]|jgi:small subunit ribosomal protein S1|uniref:S1 RNA-binding domain-containing protein n=1 Tax=Clostridium TaxID=1485 RepID=UPI0024331BE0|nr:S1 RNA-binding domain-containing protein [Clostridium tyrobutyricum]
MQTKINEIYVSKQTNKFLTGTITSIDQVKLYGEVTNCVSIVYDNYKVIIPASELGVRDDVRVIRSMIGAEIDFIITDIAKDVNIAIGSRIKAMETKRKINANKDFTDKTITAKVTGIGRNGIYVEALGVETMIPKQEVDYGFITNLRDYVQIGEKVQCKVITADIANNKLELSMKALKEDPYANLEEKFPLKSEHLASITNIQPYGVFLTFDENPKITVLCPIPKWNNFSPALRDKYVVRIKKINENKINGTLMRFVKSADE